MKNAIRFLKRNSRDLAAGAVILLLGFLFYLPIFRDFGNGIPRIDWCGVCPYRDFFRIMISQYQQFPFRVPHFCGGYPFIGFPYDISLSPLMLIVMVFGAVGGTKIIVLLAVLSGALSVYSLTRYQLRYNLAGALFSTLAFLFCSWGPCQYMQSNFEKLYFYFLPVILLLFIKSAQDKKFIFFASLVTAIVFMSAGSVIIPILIFLFLFACLNIPFSREGGRIRADLRFPGVFIAVILLAFFISMLKVLPMHELLERKDLGFIHFPGENNYPEVSRTMIRADRDVDFVKLGGWLLRKDSFRNIKSVHFPGEYGYSMIGRKIGSSGSDSRPVIFGWLSSSPGFEVTLDRDDYVQMYFGFIPLLFAAIGCLFFWKKVWRYAILLFISLVISLGPNSPVDIFKWIWHAHTYVHSIWRLDEYFTFQIFFLISVISGSFFSFFDSRKMKPLFWLAVILAVFSLNDMFWPNRRFLENRVFLRDSSELSFGKEFFHVKVKNYIGFPEPYQVDQYYYLQSNIGVTNWLFGNLAIPTNVIPRYLVKAGDSRFLPSRMDKMEVNPDYRGEAFFPQEKENHVSIRFFSPNRIRLAVQVRNPGVLLVNQNYHRDWRIDRGRVYDQNGLLAVYLEESGEYDITLSYVPLGLYCGILISIVSLSLGYYFLVYKRKRRR